MKLPAPIRLLFPPFCRVPARFSVAAWILSIFLILSGSLRAANTPPTPVIVSAVMRPNSTLMDVIYRVDDPDDATVRVRALAFVNGTRSFANVLRPVTFVEGTGSNLGDAIPANTTRVLTWNVAADWNIDLGQVKFEILALDSRGLLSFDWITIPAVNGQPALTISKDSPSDDAVLNALFWLYANNDPGLALNNGVLTGTAQSGVFHGVQIANGSSVSNYGPPFCFKRMNLDAANGVETTYGNSTARAGLLNPSNWHALNSPFGQLSILMAWGSSSYGQLLAPIPYTKLNAVAGASGSGNYVHSLALRDDGTVIGWGNRTYGQSTAPPGLTGVIAIATGSRHSLALKSDGTVVGWGRGVEGQITMPAGLLAVNAISAGDDYSLALKSDGTVVGWGSSGSSKTAIPAGLSGVTAISAGASHALALKSDGTVVAWGSNGDGQTAVPSNLEAVTAIAAGGGHSIALKSNGTLVTWGSNTKGQTSVPAGLTQVIAIAAGGDHSLALKSDGTVIAWGSNEFGQCTMPEGVSGVVFISAGQNHSLILKSPNP